MTNDTQHKNISSNEEQQRTEDSKKQMYTEPAKYIKTHDNLQRNNKARAMQDIKNGKLGDKTDKQTSAKFKQRNTRHVTNKC